MNQTNPEKRLVDPQWLRVLEYYTNLSPKQKQTYADQLSPQQSQYLEVLYALYLKDNSILNIQYIADTDIHLLHKVPYKLKHTLDKARRASTVMAVFVMIFVTATSVWLQRDTISSAFNGPQAQASYVEWAAGTIKNPLENGRFDDPDFDGLINDWEYVLDSDPLNPDSNNNEVSDGVDVLAGDFDTENIDDVDFRELSLTLLRSQLTFSDRENQLDPARTLEIGFLQSSHQVDVFSDVVISQGSQHNGVLVYDGNQPHIWFSSHVLLDKLNPGLELTVRSSEGEKTYRVVQKNIVSPTSFSTPESDQDPSLSLVAPVQFKSGVKFMRVLSQEIER